jgi:hypothetical protein
MPPKKGPNAKQVAGRDKKAVVEAKKQAVVDRKTELAEDESWKEGGNARGQARDQNAHLKADEADRKRREKAELLAAEEAELGPGGKAVKSGVVKKGAGKKKAKNSDLAFLEDSLVKGADKKVKQKKEELLKKQQQQQKLVNKEEEVLDPLLANTAEMIGNGDLAGRKANVARMQDEGSGIDAALGSLKVGVGEKKSSKALYKDFETRMLPEVKEEYPGLRLSQQKEKVWALWKKSPDNPENQQPL